MISSGGTTTLGLYDNISLINKKADREYVDGVFSTIVGGHKGYDTLALATAASASLPVNTIVEVLFDPTASNNGVYLWDGVSLDKSPYDPLTTAKNYSDLNLTKRSTDLLDITDLKLTGGNFNLINGSVFTFDGYVNSSGVFVASGAGYKATDYIYVEHSTTIKCSLHAGASVSVLAFYDANKTYISSLVGNSSNVERSFTVPSTAYYVRLSNLPANQPSPTCYVAYATNVVTESSLTLQPSLNLADLSLVVSDLYVNNAGGISSGAGWKHIKIPITPNETYTFGNFTIDSAGYYAFYDASSVLVSGAFGSYQTGTLPKTVVAPSTAAYLLIDLARPTNTLSQYDQTVCNVGSTLIPYEDPRSKVLEILNHPLIGSGGEVPSNVVVQNGNATLADVIADSVTTAALIANLPTSPVGLEVGQAYIDVDTIKVVV